jgi:hypothetical protein
MQQMPLCNKFPEDGVIAVREEFVAQFQGCLTPIVQVPAQIKPFLYLFYLLGWPLIVFMAVFGRSKQFLWLPGITLAVYALLGAGISRYGMVAYPAIIVAAYVNFTLHIKAREDREPKRD